MEISCSPLTKEMLHGAQELKVDDPDLTLESARHAADAAARSADADPMLISWYEARSGRHSPRVECCRDDKPGWLAYAESRGGSLIFSVNDASYVFVYAPSVDQEAKWGGQE